MTNLSRATDANIANNDDVDLDEIVKERARAVSSMHFNLWTGEQDDKEETMTANRFAIGHCFGQSILLLTTNTYTFPYTHAHIGQSWIDAKSKHVENNGNLYCQ